MNIVILDDYQDAVRKLVCAQKLDAYPAKVFTNTVKGVTQLSARLREAEIVILIRDRTPMNAALLDKLPKLRLVVQTGDIGTHLDVAACTARGVAVIAGGGDPRATAELTIGLLFAAKRRLPQYIANLKLGTWQYSGLKSSNLPTNFGMGTSVYGHSLGLLGYGRVAQLVAQMARGLGLRVRVWGRDASLAAAQNDGFEICQSKADLFENSDIVSLHLRATPETRGVVTLDDLLSMRATALLINTASADLITPDSLVVALTKGRPGFAAVDVFESEPILQGQSLLRLENCICTPHISYVTQDNYESLFDFAFNNTVRFIEGKPSNIINPEHLHHIRQPSLRL